MTERTPHTVSVCTRVPYLVEEGRLDVAAVGLRLASRRLLLPLAQPPLPLAAVPVPVAVPVQCCQMAKFDPFLSLDCARVEGLGAQSKERKGSNFAA